MPQSRALLHDPTAALTDRIIMDEIAAGSHVLDLGCGDGRLLCRLRDELGCTIQGVELDDHLVVDSIAKGVPVLHADLDAGLQEIPGCVFDFAVLSQTLQQVRRPRDLLLEMLRVAKRALVVVPNFGHWRVRWQIMWSGRAPMTSSLPYDWYNTPNLHFFTIIDFREMAARQQLEIVHEVPIIHGRAATNLWSANLRADSVLFVVAQKEPPA